ncbi:MAG: DUF1349 domain-containing protein [Bryobacteraceae bacterium]|nr:DUF1349 domain-containing protein [Bryobacteraceae bacterium]
MSPPVADIEGFRKQLDLVLDSAEFRTSPQLRDFLRYVGEQSFAGRESIEQVEIADKVLRRPVDFNPIEDASVRKLASTARRKLEAYYANGGSSDPVVISLPSRTYVPHFEFRPQERAEPISKPRARRWVIPLAITASAVGVTAVGWWAVRAPDAETGVFAMTTVPGNIAGGAADLAGSGLLLGPTLGSIEDLVVRLKFTPESAHQQAGLIVYQDPDNYVAFSRHFRSRAQLEFMRETGGNYDLKAGSVGYDPTGGNGEAVWLSIRRRGDRYSAYASADGREWSPFGWELSAGLVNPKLGIFACSAKDKGKPVTAVFDRLGAGLSFHHWTDELWPEAFAAGWRIESDCGERASYRTEGGSLDVTLRREGSNRCAWQFSRPAPPGDWRFATHADFLASNGAHLALRAGARRWFNLERTDLEAGSIRADSDRGGVTLPDFPGRPPLFLRIENEGGRLSGHFSRDGVRFSTPPFRMTVADLGDAPRVAIRLALDSWDTDTSPRTARFRYFVREIDSLQPYR